MTETLVDIQAAKQATILQLEAARPDHSVFVSANAGTGKTQVLTMRVLRLLFQRIDNHSYTRAQQQPMRHRLNKNIPLGDL